MESTNQQIINLFNESFASGDYTKKAPAGDLLCEHRGYCVYEPGQTPCWSPFIGDDNPKIMVVAEAPSALGGNDLWIGGLTKDIFESDEKQSKSLMAFLKFIKEYYGVYPYFTDLMKCGLNKQSNSKKRELFPKRKEKCMTKFLHKEIKIIRPQEIICVGRESYDTLLKDPLIKKLNIKLTYLMHYTQASLQMTSEEKEKILWPYQIGKLLPKEKLLDLKCFKTIKNQ